MVWAASTGGCVACMVYDKDRVASVTALLTSASVLSKCAMASASQAGGGRVRPTKGCDDWVDEWMLIASRLRLTGMCDVGKLRTLVSPGGNTASWLLELGSLPSSSLASTCPASGTW